jgi:sphingomyelin phosphodiesterase acid-like 3
MIHRSVLSVLYHLFETMKSSTMNPMLRTFIRSSHLAGVALAVAVLLPAQIALAQPSIDRTAQSASRDFPALLISDIHFDPFHDPGKVKALAAAPVAEWKSIFAAAPSPDQAAAFDALQDKCHAKGVDTPFALLNSSLQAMKSHEPGAKFMLVAGDLIAHNFTCRYAASFPNAAPGDYDAFVLKTLAFVARELRTTFPGMPVYTALGNNDSNCGDYQLDANSSFLAAAGKLLTEDLSEADRQLAAKEFAAGGYYSVKMAAPMRNTRLIVLNDVFLSGKYRACGGQPDPTAANDEMEWMKHQLIQARQAGERVWVVGHIPPGIDPYSTIRKAGNICGSGEPVRFLASDKMADLMVEYADVVRLGVFAHTHMDEMRLLEPEGDDASKHRVAVKITPSISPVDGNNPSFTIAQVNAETASIGDYRVIAASNQTGIATQWATEYDYRETFHEPSYTPAAVDELVKRLKADQRAATPESRSYLRDYFVGDKSAQLSIFWPQYVCALDNYTAQSYAACSCSAGK